jgi:hypothetical protein
MAPSVAIVGAVPDRHLPPSSDGAIVTRRAETHGWACECRNSSLAAEQHGSHTSIQLGPANRRLQPQAPSFGVTIHSTRRCDSIARLRGAT